MPKVEGIETGPSIKALYDSKGAMTGDFTLRSGVKSTVYWNLRTLRSHPQEKRTVVGTYLEMLQGLSFDHVADVPTAASPLVASIADKLVISQITPRAEVKTHGIAVPVDGDFNEGEVAIGIDDLVTSGGSIIEAVRVLRGRKVVVNDIVVLMDRQQGGEAALSAEGLRLHYAFTMKEALESLANDPTIPEEDREKFAKQASQPT